jgi:hypothetical protein
MLLEKEILDAASGCLGSSGGSLEAASVESIKQAVFDYWGRHTTSTIDRIRATPGQKAFVWGGESPREPTQLASTLILAGYEKVILIDRFSHLLGRDDMQATKTILHRPACAVYKRRFLTEAFNVQLRVLERLRPLIEAGFVEFLPPPIFWSEDAAEKIKSAATADVENERHMEVFERGLPYEGFANPLRYDEVQTLFIDYDRRVKRARYLREDARHGESIMRGPLEELNEALYGRGMLWDTDNSVDLITDRQRHWDWLDWKLQSDCDPVRKSFNGLQTSWIRGMDAHALVKAYRDGALDALRNFFRTELPALSASADRFENVIRTWPSLRKRVDEEVRLIRRSYRRGVGRDIGLAILTVGFASPLALSFPEWLAVATPYVSAALGYSLADILKLRRVYDSDRQRLLASNPLYLFLSVQGSALPQERVPAID